jgi:hypothetical protein
MRQFQKEQSDMMSGFLAEQRERDLLRDSQLEGLKHEFKESCGKIAQQVVELRENTKGLSARLSEVSACATSAATKIESIEQRLSALESNAAKGASIPLQLDSLIGRAAGSGFGGAGGPSGPPGPPGRGGDVGPFVPTKVFLRGWSTYGQPETGISEERVLSIMDALLSSVPEGQRGWVARCQAPYFRNWQGTFSLHPFVTSDQAFQLCKSFNTHLEGEAVLVNGKKLFTVVEAPAWKRLRNAALMRAQEAFLRVRPGWAHRLKVDFAGGELWCTEPVVSIGSWSRSSQAWAWKDTSLLLLQVTKDELEAPALPE